MVVAACIETPTRFARYTVSNAVAIPIGTLMKLSGDNTAIASSANSDVFAGIAWEEKTASDGLTEQTSALNGIWDLTCGGAGVTLGALVSLSGANLIKDAIAAEILSGDVIGKALEAGSAADLIRVRVGESV